jgi:hypothetical protein
MFYIKEKAKRYIDDLKQYVHIDKMPIKDFKFYQGDISLAYRPNFNDEDWRIFNIRKLGIKR